MSSSASHPKGLYLLFFTEMWERFSYYGMRGILILYLTKQLIEGGLAIDASSASLIYGYFTGFVYFTPLIGGWLADNFLGQRKSITIGGITMMIGQFTLFAYNTQAGLFLGLFLLIIGNGFFKPNISTLVGQLYAEKDPRRDSAFSIFYMGINLGAFLAPLIIGYAAESYFVTRDAEGNIMAFGYKYGFLIAGIGMLLGQVLFNTLADKYLPGIGHAPAKKSSSNELDENILKKPLTKEERQRVIATVIITSFVVFFWAGFEQAGSSLSLYTDKFVDRDFMGFLIPTSYFQAVNPLFIVAIAPLFAWFWNTEAGKKLTTPVKMGMGMILLGVGFFFMLGAVAQRGGDIQDTAIKASLSWLVLTYFFHTIGELCLSPVGLSVVTKLAPIKFASLMMGVWLMSSFFANIIGGYVASIVESMGAGDIFTFISAFVIVLGVILIALNKPMLRLMNGVR